jgi:hypothetical protein
MLNGTNSMNIVMDLVFSRICQLSSMFSHMYYYHVLRDNNVVVDQLENQATPSGGDHGFQQLGHMGAYTLSYEMVLDGLKECLIYM